MNRTAMGLIIAAMVVLPSSFNALVEPVQAQGVGSPVAPFRDWEPLPNANFGVGEPQPGVSIDIGFFYDRLAPYGNWREHPPWGWVWSPRGVPVNWRPYTFGHWVFTDDYGWLWESDEDWGWACFHYGRWDWDDEFGWFWVPGSYWGPAWVAWRTGPGFIGWCPLPPPVRWRAGVGLDFGGFDLDEIPAWQWVFVDTTFFDAPRLHDHIFLPSRNVIFLRETRSIVRFESVGGRIVNRAFSDRDIEAFTHRPVPHFRVRHVDSPSAMRTSRERDGEVSVFNPRIGRGPAGLTPPGPGELERRQKAERSQLQEQQRAELSRQEERHRTERAAPGANTEQLQGRHEAERQALQGEHERQRQTLENRHMRERQESAGPPARASEPARPQARANAPAGGGRFAGTPEAQGRGTRR